MAGFVDEVTSKEALLVPGEEPRQLTKEEQVSLMKRFIQFQAIDEFLDVYRSCIRRFVFDHITMEHVALGTENPEHQNGVIKVEEYGMKFCKEGAGRKTPTIDHKKLRGEIGDDLYEQCLIREEIPAHVEVSFSQDKFMRLVQEEPRLLEALRVALIPGDWKTERFAPKKI